MRPDSITQEILLVTTSSFAKRELCDGDAEDKNRPHEAAEQLEIACWNGLLDELLPEINQHSPVTSKLFLWEVELRKSCLLINRGEYPPIPEWNFTIDPQVFLYALQMN